MDNSSCIYKLWRTATRLPTTIAAAATFFFSTTCPFQVEEDGDIWRGAVWWGREGAGQEGGGTRSGRDQQQQQQLEAGS